MLLLLAVLAQAAPPTSTFIWQAPETPARVEGECSGAVDLVVGKSVPASLVDGDGLVRCYSTAVPTSDLAGLLLVDSWARRAAPRGARLDLEVSWERERYARLSAAYEQPTPWLQRPATQRTLGRLETVGVMVLSVGLYAVLDNGVVK